MLGYGMGDLVSQHDSQGSLILRHRQQSFVNDNLSSGHTEGIDIVVLHQIELPLILAQLGLHAITAEEAGNSTCQSLTYTLHHGGIGCIGRPFGTLHILIIFLRTKAQDFSI